MKNFSRKSPPLVYMLVVIGVVIIAIISAQLSSQVSSINKKVSQNSDILISVFKLQRDFLNYEAAFKEHINRPDSATLSKVTLLPEQILRNLKTLRALSEGEHQEQLIIDSLILYLNSQVGSTQNSIAVIKDGGRDRVKRIMKSGQGDQDILVARNLMEKLEKLEDQELKEYLNQREAANAKFNQILFFLFLILTFFGLGYFLQLRKSRLQNKSIHQNARYQELILSSITDAVLITDTKFRIISCNRSAEELYGFREKDVKGKEIAEAVRSQMSPDQIEAIRLEMNTRGTWNGEAIHKNAEGREITVQSFRTALKDNHGNIIGFVSSNRDITEQKLAENLLNKFTHELSHKVREKTAELSENLERITDAFIALDKEWKYTFINNKAEQFLGKSKVDLLGVVIWREFSEGVGEQFHKACEQAMFRQEYMHLEDFYSPNQRWFEYHIYPSPTGLSVYFRDITEKKKTELRLQENEQKYRSLVEQSLTGIYIIQNGKFIYVNPEFAAIFGYTQEEMQDKIAVRDVVHPSDIEMVMEMARLRLAGKMVASNYHFKGLRKDKTMIHVEVFGSKAIHNGQPVIIGTLMDNTEKVQASEKIKKTNERLELLSRATNDAVWEWDLQTNEVWGNEIHQNMYGLTASDPGPDEFEWRKRLHPEDVARMIAINQELKNSSNKVFQSEYRFFSENKGWIDILDRTYVERDKEGKALRMIGAMQDITDLKNSERLLARSETNLRHILSSASESFYVIDTGCNVTLINHQAQKNLILAWKKPVTVGTNLLDVIPDNSDENIREKISKVLLGEKVEYEHYIQTENLSPWWAISFMPVKDEKGSVIGAYISTRDITARKVAEEALKASEEKYRSLIQQASEPILIYSYDGVIHEFNDKAWEVSGYTKEEFSRLKLSDILVGNFINNQETYDALMTGQIITIIRKFRRKDHAERDFEIVARKISENKILAFGRDISERQRNEEAIRREKELSDSVINSLPGIFYIFDQTPKMHRWNKRFEVISGYSAEELSEISPHKLFHKDDVPKMQKMIAGIYKTGSCEIEARLVTRDKRIIPFILTGNLIEYLGVQCILGTGIDISERKKIESELANNENHLRTIIQTEPECVKLIGKNHELLDMNPAGLAMIEAGHLDLVKGKDVSVIVNEPYKKAFKKLTDRVLKGETGSLLFEITGLKGTKRWLESNATPLRNAEGEVVSMLAVTRDVTERKKAEEKIIREKELSDSIINNLPDIFYLFTESGKFLRWNLNFEKVTGFKNDEIETLNPFHLFADHNKDTLKKKINEIKEKGTVSFEGDFQTKDKQWIPYYFKGWNILYEGESCIIGIGIDMTNRIQAELEIKKANERFELIAKATNDFVWDVDLQENKIWRNQNFYEHFGYRNNEQLEGVGSWEESIHPDDRARVIKSYNSILKNRDESIWTDEYRIKKLDGTFLSVYDRGYIVRNKAGKAIRIMGAMTDLTSIRMAEEEVRMSEEKYRKLFNNNPMPIWMISLDNYKFLDVNEAAIKHYGYSRNEFLNMDIFSIWADVDSNNKVNILGSGKEKSGHYLCGHRKKNGTEISVEVSYFDTHYEGVPVRIALGVDVTSRLHAEKLLRESYRDIKRLATHLEQVREEERVNIAREIHDELGQQLTVLKMDISWLNKKILDEDESVRNRLQNLMEIIDHTVITVRKISSDLRPSILDDLGLSAALEWQCQQFESRSGIKTRFLSDVDDSNLSVLVSTGLYRIFQECLTNIARHSEASQVKTSLERKNGKIQMKIQDNGKGFVLNGIETKKTLGILGMKERARILDADYEISSEPGKGTKVVVSIQMKKETQMKLN